MSSSAGKKSTSSACSSTSSVSSPASNNNDIGEDDAPMTTMVTKSEDEDRDRQQHNSGEIGKNEDIANSKEEGMEPEEEEEEAQQQRMQIQRDGDGDGSSSSGSGGCFLREAGGRFQSSSTSILSLLFAREAFGHGPSPFFPRGGSSTTRARPKPSSLDEMSSTAAW